jgi:uncharacterized protein YecE (DUF72 family)
VPQGSGPRIWVGTSGWQYADWRGRLYPRALPQTRWLECYAESFPTVELNNSFYRLPSEQAFHAWARRTPPGFVMAVKASRFITHVRRLREPRDPVRLLWSRTDALGDRRGPVLFQLPPTMPLDLGRLSGLLGELPTGMRAAFEFRHESWMREEVLAELDAAGAAFVLADRPGRRVGETVTGGWAYVRLHQGRADDPGYTREKLRRWAGRILELPAREVYVYFNNDTGGAAVRDARTLTDLLVKRGARVATPA